MSRRGADKRLYVPLVVDYYYDVCNYRVIP